MNKLIIMNLHKSLPLLVMFGCLLVVASSAAEQKVGGDQLDKLTSTNTDAQAWKWASMVSLDKLMDFESFRVKYKKHYSNAAELARRAKLFMARAFAVFVSGIKYRYKLATKFLRISPRSDWTRQERRAIETGLRPAKDEKLTHAEELEMKSLLAELDSGHERQKRSPPSGSSGGDRVYLDYRDTGCFLPPKSQYNCGSCYVFSAIAILEYHHCRQTGELVSFSEQYVIDCGNGRSLNLAGCEGGCPSQVGPFSAECGLELSSDYPYVAEDQECPYPSNINTRRWGYTRNVNAKGNRILDRKYFKPRCIQQMLEAKGPLYIGVVTDEYFSDFGGGVDQLRCARGSDESHSMVVVGHGIENGLEYWLLRNSYGVDFGEQGYYKLAKDVPDYCIVQFGFMLGRFERNQMHEGRSYF